MNVVDSSGWIEYLQKSSRAGLYRKAILDPANLVVPAICIYEVYRLVFSKMGKTLAESSVRVMESGLVVELTATLAVEAAALAIHHQLAMADAIIYATAQKHRATLWTQDADLGSLPGVKYFQKMGAARG